MKYFFKIILMHQMLRLAIFEGHINQFLTRLISFVLLMTLLDLNGLKNDLSKTKLGPLRFEIITNRGQIKMVQ